MERSHLSLILVDSEIELVPERFWSHPAVVINARKRKKKPSRVLLDSNLHHSLFSDHEERNRRGRPDIVHQFLLIGLESILGMDGDLSLYVHTRNDELITVSPETRLPKNYNRFSGLFEELFRSGSVPAGKDPLITLEHGMTLEKIVRRVKKDSLVVTLDHSGEPKRAYDLAGVEKPVHMICMIGGFSSGKFRSDPVSLSDLTVSLHDKELKSWSVEMELISAFYNVQRKPYF